MKTVIVVGARPNFIKVSPLLAAIDNYNKGALPGKKIYVTLVHTGQHYDDTMSKVFFKDLQLPRPGIHLGVGSGSQGEQTGRIISKFEKALAFVKPDIVVVMGDVNSTLAAALCAAKLRIPIAHIEAGLRSYDRSMPEEINRVLTDAVSDFLFTPSADADENLLKEGIPAAKIFLVGDIVVDSLLRNKQKAESSSILSRHHLKSGDYALLTLHRAANVDRRHVLDGVLKAVKIISKRIPIVFPVHPRTKKQLKQFRLQGYLKKGRIIITDPVGYLDCLKLEMNARFVMTDSGGMQQETSCLNIPCLTLRENTERPLLLVRGTNQLVGTNPQNIVRAALQVLSTKRRKSRLLPCWDGRTSDRIVKILVSSFNNNWVRGNK